MDVPDRDPVPPPQLSRDAPVPNVSQPRFVDFLEPRGDDRELAGLNRGERGLRHSLHLHEPLLRDERLDDLAASLRPWHACLIRLGLDRDARGLHVRPELGAALGPVQAFVLPRVAVHGSVLVHDVNRREPDALANLVIVRVVPWGDLERAGAKLDVHVIVPDDRDGPAA